MNCGACERDVTGEHVVVNQFGITLCKECYCTDENGNLSEDAVEEWDRAEVTKQ